MPDQVVWHCRPIDYSKFGPLVFPLLKLYFAPHPLGDQRRLLDTLPMEASRVAQHTGHRLYHDEVFFDLSSIEVAPEECCQLLQKLRVMVTDAVQESVHPFDRYNNLLAAAFVVV